MRCHFYCYIYYTNYIILTRFIKQNVWYYNVTHSYKVDYRLLSHITCYLYEIIVEFLSRVATERSNCSCVGHLSRALRRYPIHHYSWRLEYWWGHGEVFWLASLKTIYAWEAHKVWLRNGCFAVPWLYIVVPSSQHLWPQKKCLLAVDKMVLHLLSYVPHSCDHTVFFDNFFTS